MKQIFNAPICVTPLPFFIELYLVKALVNWHAEYFNIKSPHLKHLKRHVTKLSCESYEFDSIFYVFVYEKISCMSHISKTYFTFLILKIILKIESNPWGLKRLWRSNFLPLKIFWTSLVSKSHDKNISTIMNIWSLGK